MFLSILKIIGIVLLVILALFILILGMILLVPIRYQFAGEYKEEHKADILVKWTPVFLKVTANYRENNLEYMVRMFGGVVMTNTDVPLSWLGRKLFASTDRKTEGDAPKDTLEEEYNAEKKDICVPSDTPVKKQAVAKDKKTGVKKSFLDKIRDKIHNVKSKVNQWISKLKKLNDKREALLKVYHSKRFEIAKKDAVQYIKDLWVIVRPRKLEGYIHFGLDNPGDTGQALGVMAMFLVWYDDFLKVEPDFEKACLDGYLNGKGKFRLFSIVKWIIKIAFNKNLIKVIKKVQNIIEA